MVVDAKKIREQLAKGIQRATNEINQNGLDSIYTDGQAVISAQIIINIDNDMSVEIEYKRNVIPRHIVN